MHTHPPLQQHTYTYWHFIARVQPLCCRIIPKHSNLMHAHRQMMYLVTQSAHRMYRLPSHSIPQTCSATYRKCCGKFLNPHCEGSQCVPQAHLPAGYSTAGTDSWVPAKKFLPKCVSTGEINRTALRSLRGPPANHSARTTTGHFIRPNNRPIRSDCIQCWKAETLARQPGENRGRFITAGSMPPRTAPARRPLSAARSATRPASGSPAPAPTLARDRARRSSWAIPAAADRHSMSACRGTR